MTNRFKIDVGAYRTFGVFVWRPSWIGGNWEYLTSFDTYDEAKAHYETIKNMPEYLP